VVALLGIKVTHVFQAFSANVQIISGRFAASSLYTVQEEAIRLLPPDAAEFKQYNASMSGVISL
jgi:hypothetical protein